MACAVPSLNLVYTDERATSRPRRPRRRARPLNCRARFRKIRGRGTCLLPRPSACSVSPACFTSGNPSARLGPNAHDTNRDGTAAGGKTRGERGGGEAAVASASIAAAAASGAAPAFSLPLPGRRGPTCRRRDRRSARAAPAPGPILSSRARAGRTRVLMSCPVPAQPHGGRLGITLPKALHFQWRAPRSRSRRHVGVVRNEVEHHGLALQERRSWSASPSYHSRLQ